MVAALEVVVGEDRTAHDGKISVGADEVVGELIDKVKHARKAVVGDAHGHVLVVEHDAVLAVVEVGGILHVPALAVERQRDHAVVLPRGEADAARVAGIFRAEHAPGIAGLLGAALRGDIARVLLRLGKVDGNLQLAGLGVLKEAHVFGDAVHLDVVAVAAEFVEPLRSRRGAAFLVELEEALAHALRLGREQAHQFGGEQVAVFAAVLDDALHRGGAGQRVEHLRGRLRRGDGRIVDLLRRVHAHDLQQAVDVEGPVLRLDHFLGDGKVHQMVDPLSHVRIHCITSLILSNRTGFLSIPDAKLT